MAPSASVRRAKELAGHSKQVSSSAVSTATGSVRATAAANFAEHSVERFVLAGWFDVRKWCVKYLA